MKPDDHAELLSLLAGAGLDLSPTELQGQLTGLWCRYAQLPTDLGLSEPVPAAWQEPLRAYAASVWRSLEDPQCGFMPMLPGDESPLAERVAALAEWCAAVLYGIGHAGELDPEALAPDVREALDDLVQISRAQAQHDEQEDEQAYAEIVEYLRVLAQTLYVELHPNPKTRQLHEH